MDWRVVALTSLLGLYQIGAAPPATAEGVQGCWHGILMPSTPDAEPIFVVTQGLAEWRVGQPITLYPREHSTGPADFAKSLVVLPEQVLLAGDPKQAGYVVSMAGSEQRASLMMQLQPVLAGSATTMQEAELSVCGLQH